MRNDLTKQVAEYLAFLANEKGLRKNTILAYQQDLMEFLAFLQGEDISDWPDKASDINAFIARQKKSASSIRRLISTLRKFYQWLARRGYQKINPMLEIDAPPLTKAQAVSLTLPEVQSILQQPDTSKLLGLRDRAIIVLLYTTGIKVGELVNLKPDAFLMEVNLFKVLSADGRERLLPISDEALAVIEKYRQKMLSQSAGQERAKFFCNNRGGGLTRQAVWQMLKRYCQQAEITKEVNTHTLRNTFISQMLANGADSRVIDKMLDRADPNGNYYGPVTQKQIIAVYQKCYPRL